MLHAHLEVKALPHTTLARLWQLSCFHWLIVSRVEKLPQKLSTMQYTRPYHHMNNRENDWKLESPHYHTQSAVEGSVFGTVSLWCFVCVWNIPGTAEWICVKFTRKMCLIPRLDEFEGQGQKSRSLGTKNGIFWPFWRPGCGLCLIKHLWPLVWSCIHHFSTTFFYDAHAHSCLIKADFHHSLMLFARGCEQCTYSLCGLCCCWCLILWPWTLTLTWPRHFHGDQAITPKYLWTSSHISRSKVISFESYCLCIRTNPVKCSTGTNKVVSNKHEETITSEI